MAKFNDQFERMKTGWNGFLVARTTFERHESKTKNKDKPTKNHKKITEK